MSKITIWKQFIKLCKENAYKIEAETSVVELNGILEDLEEKINSEGYKESGINNSK